tara:strand:- start:347 stop:628 length:282 start_codon:yes stop_codon:yes gene_type:complete
MELNGIIRKITLGDIKEGITYKKGQKMRVPNSNAYLEIIDITRDDEYFNYYNKTRFNVFVKPSNEEYTRLWKSFIDTPVSIEYDIKIEDYETY